MEALAGGAEGPRASGGAGGPPAVRQAVLHVRGHATNLLTAAYTDRILVIVTQRGKVGTYIDARCDVRSEGRPSSFKLQTLLGVRDEPVFEIYARQLIERVAATTARPLLLGITLDDTSPEACREILARLDEPDLACWK